MVTRICSLHALVIKKEREGDRQTETETKRETETERHRERKKKNEETVLTQKKVKLQSPPPPPPPTAPPFPWVGLFLLSLSYTNNYGNNWKSITSQPLSLIFNCVIFIKTLILVTLGRDINRSCYQHRIHYQFLFCFLLLLFFFGGGGVLITVSLQTSCTEMYLHIRQETTRLFPIDFRVTILSVS